MARQSIISKSINTIRALSMDAIENAGSGHPGLPLGAADMGYVLFRNILKHNPKNSHWLNRDRFILSAGHGSMLLYSLLHLSGYNLPMSEIKKLRTWQSKTPGHPEYGHTDGVEMTTGPLGQGVSSAAGFALAEAHLAAEFNKPKFKIVDHFTYALVGDGDLMEGISAEAASLAGHLGLGKLIVLYDDNQITLDADASVSFSENVLNRYKAYGWQTIRVKNGNDATEIEAALKEAKSDTSRPTLIAARTIIGYGAPNKQGSSKAHGSPLGADEIKLAKDNLSIDWPAFSVPKDVKTHFAKVVKDGKASEQKWNKLFRDYKKAYPELAAEFERRMAKALPKGLGKAMPKFPLGEAMATRNASSIALNALAAKVPELIGGSADLAGSTKTDIKDSTIIAKNDYSGRNIYFGVREHAMGAIANGMSLHGGLIPYAGTFLVFADYLRPSIRLAALMGLQVIYVFTHDSIGVGGDGPTHQPISATSALRLIPNLTVIRPADANETAQAWLEAVKRQDSPTALVLTRQNLPNLDVPKKAVAKGAYILADSDKQPELILIATGSEVHLCLEAKVKLDKAGIVTRVVSMPSFEIFEEQSKKYQETVLPKAVRARLAVEAGSSLPWYKYTGLDGKVIAIDHYGASADGDLLMKEYGFSVSNIVKTAKSILKG
ncbi:MAG TPA: transketolase [Trueperaceae bacterium]|nr:transketolase [Trueperaceae bacterium]